MLHVMDVMLDKRALRVLQYNARILLKVSLLSIPHLLVMHDKMFYFLLGKSDYFVYTVVADSFRKVISNTRPTQVVAVKK